VSDAESFQIDIGEGEAARQIAVLRRAGTAPPLVWLGGFRSDMTGTKAAALDAWAARHGRSMIRFDYSGHGQSGGDFLEGTISRWLAESHAVVDAFCKAPPVLIGSSMGGCLAMLMALGRFAAGTPLAGLVLIAPAVDMTERLMWEQFDEATRSEILEKGVWTRPSAYDPEGYPITRGLIEDGRNYLIMDRATLQVGCPVHILHGREDPDVPLSLSLELVSRLAHDDVTLTIVHDGDHRLSREEDIALLLRVVGGMVEEVG
jgi:pimeloyl-ACP methyl ester carboxylesterase